MSDEIGNVELWGGLVKHGIRKNWGVLGRMWGGGKVRGLKNLFDLTLGRWGKGQRDRITIGGLKKGI